MAIDISATRPDDLHAVCALLVDAHLPLDGVREHFRHFLVAREADTIVGTIGLEPYGESGLLRSLVVHPHHRGRGIGGMLVDRLMERAHDTGSQRLVLLTETAGRFFASHGFVGIAREEADPAVQASVEFRHACPVSAVCMRKTL